MKPSPVSTKWTRFCRVVTAASRRSFPRPRTALLLSVLFSPLLRAAEPATSVQPVPSASTLSDAAILAGARTLSLEERRYLVYLYARLDKPKVAESLAETILAASPPDRQTLLVLASMYLEQRDAAATLRTARRFLAAYPEDNQGLYFLGAGHYLAREFAEANRILRDLKHAQFAGRKYPYETDLAASAFAAGDWYRAMLAYQRLLRHHDLGDELRDDVRRALDGIYREHLPRVDLTGNNVALDRAEVSRARAVHGRHLNDRLWLEQRYARDDVTLEPAPGLVGSRRVREEFAAHLAMVHDGRWRSEAWLGRSGEGAYGGARANYHVARQREASLEAAVNVSANDSLTLEALDGRQHHLAAVINWLIEADLTLAARAHVREVQLAGNDLGRGAGLDVNLDYTVWRQGPRITAGYRGSVARFSPNAAFRPEATAPLADPTLGLPAQEAIAANLVSRRINRHGTGLLITDNLADAWVYRLNAGVDYDFELSSVGWNGAAAVTFHPRKSIELTAEAAYTSSATASNAGSAARLVNLFIRFHY